MPDEGVGERDLAIGGVGRVTTFKSEEAVRFPDSVTSEIITFPKCSVPHVESSVNVISTQNETAGTSKPFSTMNTLREEFMEKETEDKKRSYTAPSDVFPT